MTAAELAQGQRAFRSFQVLPQPGLQVGQVDFFVGTDIDGLWILHRSDI